MAKLDAWPAQITDRCFRVPVPVTALVDRVLADDTVARALLARGNPVLVEALGEREDRGRREGLKEGHKEGHKEGRKEGHREGLDQGLGPLVHLFERKLRRALSDGERHVLQVRLDTHGPARLGDVVLDLDPDALARWMADPDAR